MTCQPGCSRSRLPGVGCSETGALLLGALSIVFVGYSESLAAGRAMARKHGYEIDTNQELIAQGMACGAAGFVGGFATDGSLSKTSVADDGGPALADGLADQRRLRPADDAVPRRPLQGPPERDTRRRRHRCDARAGHLRRVQALPPRESSRLGLLHGRGPGDPVLRDHPGHRHRRGPVAPAADRALVADLRPRAQTQPDHRDLPRGPAPRGSGGRPRGPHRPRRRAALLRRRRPLPHHPRGSGATRWDARGRWWSTPSRST